MSFLSLAGSLALGLSTDEFEAVRKIGSKSSTKSKATAGIQNPSGTSPASRSYGESSRATTDNMTLIPAENDSRDHKDPAGPGAGSLREGEQNQEPASPPPYSLFATPDSSVVAHSPNNNTNVPPYTPIPSTASTQPQAQAPAVRIPESDAISASGPVHLTGPLSILGACNSSSTIVLSHHIRVGGKVNASSSITLRDDIIVDGKVDASSKVRLENGVFVRGKVDASGSVDIIAGEGGVVVEGKVDASGNCLVDGSSTSSNGSSSSSQALAGKDGAISRGVTIGGKLHSSGNLEIRGNVSVGGDVESSGKIKIFGVLGAEKGGEEWKSRPGGVVRVGGKISGSGGCKVEGDVIAEKFSVSGTLSLNGRLYVKGDLTVKGNVTLQPGSELVIDGKRTIHGSLKQL